MTREEHQSDLTEDFPLANITFPWMLMYWISIFLHFSLTLLNLESTIVKTSMISFPIKCLFFIQLARISRTYFFFIERSSSHVFWMVSHPQSQYILYSSRIKHFSRIILFAIETRTKSLNIFNYISTSTKTSKTCREGIQQRFRFFTIRFLTHDPFPSRLLSLFIETFIFLFAIHSFMPQQTKYPNLGITGYIDDITGDIYANSYVLLWALLFFSLLNSLV